MMQACYYEDVTGSAPHESAGKLHLPNALPKSAKRSPMPQLVQNRRKGHNDTT
jgi:hypothetical protein